MSIASRIENMYDNVDKAYKSIGDLGVDLTNVDKNLENLSTKIEEIYDTLPKVESEDTDQPITLENTAKGKLKLDLKGNTQQNSTTGKNLLPYNTLTTTTENGITFTPVFEGNNLLYIRAKGTARANTTYRFYGINTTTPQKTFNSATKINFGLTGSSSTYGVVVWGLNSGGTDIGAVIYDDTEYATGFQLAGIGLRVYSGANVDIQFKPMIRLSSIADDTYEPYTGSSPSPSPDYPQDIHIVSGDNTITIANSDNTETQTQLISLGVENLWKNQLTGFLPQSGSYPTINSTYPNARYILVNLLKGQSITLSGSTSSMGRVRYIDKDTNQIIGMISKGETEYYKSSAFFTGQFDEGTITAKKDFIVGIMDMGGSVNDLIVNYGKLPSYVSDNPIELCKIGNYEDRPFKADNDDDFYKTLDSATKQTLTYGKWYLHKEIGKVVLDENSEDIQFGSSGSNYTRFNVTITGVILGNTSTYTLIRSDYYYPKYAIEPGAIFISSTQNIVGIVHNSVITLADYKTWLSTHNVSIYYVLATPTNTEITDTTLISQLENTLYSYTGQTNISQENNDEPFIIKASALRDFASLE